MTIEEATTLASDHFRAHRLPDAERLCRQILAAKPDHAPAMQLLGLIAAQAGQLPAAVDLIERAIVVGPVAPDWLHNFRVICQRANQTPRAVALLEHAAKAYPDSAIILFNLGSALFENHQHPQAVEALQRAIQLQPSLSRVHGMLALTLAQLGQLDTAIASFDLAIQQDPRDVVAISNRAHALERRGDFTAAADGYRKAISIRPNDPTVHGNLGGVLAQLHDMPGAIAAVERGISICPGSAELHYNLANLLRDTRQYPQAMAAYEKSFAVDPNYGSAHWNYGLLLLKLGDFARGWQEYEWRWKAKNSPAHRPFPQPLWHGEPLAGRTLLVHAEQGFGDTFQFVRYLKLIAAPQGAVLLECPAAVIPLIAHSLPEFQIHPAGDPLPAFDVQCPLLSLPRIFGTKLETIPADVPYLQADPQRVAQWQSRFLTDARIHRGGDSDQDCRPLRVGIAWAGSVITEPRCLSVDQIAPLGNLPDVQLFSLQKGPAAIDATHVPEGISIIDLAGDLHDFADTAAVVDQLDLVISVDTSVAHLVGAMGKPVWTLLIHDAEWRWLIDREDSPWYPTMRLIRQTSPGDWAGVIQRCAKDLLQLAAQMRSKISDASRSLH